MIARTFAAMTSLHSTDKRFTIFEHFRPDLRCSVSTRVSFFSNRAVSMLDKSSELGVRCRRCTDGDKNGIDEEADEGLLISDPPLCHGSKWKRTIRISHTHPSKHCSLTRQNTHTHTPDSVTQYYSDRLKLVKNKMEFRKNEYSICEYVNELFGSLR